MTHIDDLEFLSKYKDDGDENVNFSPLLAWRLRRAYEDSELLRKHLRIESGVRPKSEQEELYAGYKAGKKGFNLAANPERVIGTHNGNTWYGSYHMEQPDGYGHAVDLTTHWKVPWGEVHKLLRAWGLHKTIPSEDWHHQAETIKGPLPGPFPDDWPIESEAEIMTPEMQEAFDDLKTWVFNSTKMIRDDLKELREQMEAKQ